MPEQRAVLAIPGDLSLRTGGYAYDRRMLAELPAIGWQMQHVELSGQFPSPDAATLAATYRLLAALPHDRPIVVDGLALGALPDIGRHLSPRHRLVALVHHPLALESGLSPDRARAFRDSERQALAAARHVIVNSRHMAATLMADYAVPQASITMAAPGTDPAPQARGSDSDVPHLVSIGSLVPRKGHDVLIAALASLRDLPWRLTIAGDASFDPRTAEALRQARESAGLSTRIAFTGALGDAEIEQLYDSADLFVLASRYEGYGMVFGEALARGLPVIGTRTGAVAEVVPDGTGLLVAPDDVAALATALASLLCDKPARDALANAARAVACGLPRWRDTAHQFGHALRASQA